MRRIGIGFIATVLLAACADRAGTGGGTAGPTEPPIDERRIGIYEAVIRDQVEFKRWHVWILDRICTDSDGADEPTGDCPDRFSAGEQAALSVRLADLGDVRFVDGTDAITQRILDGELRGQIIRVGPVEQRDGRIEVAASHFCGGLCGGGSVWVIEETRDGWKVIGPAPDHGVWIS